MPYGTMMDLRFANDTTNLVETATGYRVENAAFWQSWLSRLAGLGFGTFSLALAGGFAALSELAPFLPDTVRFAAATTAGLLGGAMVWIALWPRTPALKVDLERQQIVTRAQASGSLVEPLGTVAFDAIEKIAVRPTHSNRSMEWVLEITPKNLAPVEVLRGTEPVLRSAEARLQRDICAAC